MISCVNRKLLQFLLLLFYSLFIGIISFSYLAHARTSKVLADQDVQSLDDYYKTGKYHKEFQNVIRQAHHYILSRAKKVENPAIILDIDETLLSNWPQMHANHYIDRQDETCSLSTGPCGMSPWLRSRKALAFPGIVDFVNQMKANHVTIFLLTGRKNKYREDTQENLHKVGINGWQSLYMRLNNDDRLAAEYKPEARKTIEEQGYHIIATIGDQESDLTGGYAEKGFLVPNPFYKIP